MSDTHTVTLDLPVGEGANDLYQAFTSIFENLFAFKNSMTEGEYLTSLTDLQKAQLDGATTLAKTWSDKLQRYG